MQPSLGWLARELGTKTELHPVDVQASGRHAGCQQPRHLEDRDSIAQVHLFETNLKDRARQKKEKQREGEAHFQLRGQERRKEKLSG